ncbi:hypothetical protein PMAYCL1PPCAC_26126, partial [Pristionchus mayeri]
VPIQVLSNGTTHMAPSIAIQTSLQTYLFNVPEGTSRFLFSHGLKPGQICDVFITRAVWTNISGISSLLLRKLPESPTTRIHGAVDIRNFLSSIRPFPDADCGGYINYPSTVEGCSLETHNSYEDAIFKVQYIPLLPDQKTLENTTRKNATDLAYYIEMKSAPSKIDLVKLMRMGVPREAWEKIKSGESIVLPNGREVRTEDAMADEVPDKLKRLLIVDAADEGYARSLYKNNFIRSLSGRDSSEGVNFVVHLTPEKVLKSKEYERWARELGPQCTHIVANGSGPVVPHIETMYRHARMLHELQPALFDELRPRGWRGIVSQDAYLGVNEDIWLRAAPLQRWNMRKVPTVSKTREEIFACMGFDSNRDQTWRKDARGAILAAKEAAAALGASTPSDSSFPRVTFLGTSSARPASFRNVSGYLLETSPSSAFLIDAGESTYGQLRVILDDDVCEEVLVNLHAIFITHAHEDHVTGLLAVIEKRREAFEKKGLAYIPLVVVCNRNAIRTLQSYSGCFEDLERYVKIVQVVNLVTTRAHQASDGRPSPRKKSRIDDWIPAPPTVQVTNKIRSYDREKWGLDRVMAVQVRYLFNYYLFIYFIFHHKEIVFSGDTGPCELLVEHGMDADLLIHEATFYEVTPQRANGDHHSTVGQAVEIAEKMRAKHCILTHFAAPYPKLFIILPEYLDEKKIGVAMDGLRVGFDRLDLVPLMNPIYR